MPSGYYQLNGLYEYDGSRDVICWTFWNETTKKNTLSAVIFKIQEMLAHDLEFEEILIRFVKVQKEESHGEKS